MPRYTFNSQGALVNPSTQTDGTNQLAVVTSIQQVVEMTNDNMSLTLPESTVISLDEIQSMGYLENFKQEDPTNVAELLEELSNEFSKLEISLGLLEKFFLLKGRHLKFWLDDSGSMAGFSDVSMSEAHPALKAQYDSYSVHNKTRIAATKGSSLCMTRWGEQQNRLHIMVDLLAYIPTGPLSFTFINNLSNMFTITPEQRRTMTSAQFKDNAHQLISRAFDRGPMGGTPLLKTLKEAFKNDKVRTVHYLMTDGEPTDCTKDGLVELINTRGLGYRGRTWDSDRVPADVQAKAELNPLTLISCTNNNAEVDYFRMIDESAPMVAEIDDFNEEKKEVASKQGHAFPFTKGLWILCQLVAALDPKGLDKLDGTEYLSMEFLSLLTGHQLSAPDYEYYKQNHPATKRLASGAGHNSHRFYNNSATPYAQKSQEPEPEKCVIS